MATGMFVDILQPAMSRDNTSPDDLVTEDGLRLCAVCGEKKQTWFGVEGLIPTSKVPCMCKCERDKLAAEEAARKRQEMALRIDQYRRKGLTDEQYRACTFAADDGADAKTGQFCRAYADNWEWALQNNAGLMLWGDVGGGKTFYAACIANALIDKGIPATMTTIPRLVSAMSKDFGAERGDVLAMVEKAPLLVLDDVGTERDTEYSNEQVYEIINTRYKAKKPLIVTTNLTMAAIKNAEDVTKRRIYDRIIEMCTPCKVSGSGRRQAAARNKMEQMMQQFGLED